MRKMPQTVLGIQQVYGRDIFEVSIVKNQNYADFALTFNSIGFLVESHTLRKSIEMNNF